MKLPLGFACSTSFVLAACLVLACASSNKAAVTETETEMDASRAVVDDDAADAPEPKDATAAPDASDAAAPACTGACRTTSLVVTIGGETRSLNRAQFGTVAGDAGTLLHVEAHEGGKPECPSETSPSPAYTLIVSQVPHAATSGSATERDGIRSVFFDFRGDLGLPPLVRATAVTVTARVEDPAPTPAWFAFDVVATFAEGTVSGHVYAEYCPSLSD